MPREYHMRELAGFSIEERGMGFFRSDFMWKSGLRFDARIFGFLKTGDTYFLHQTCFRCEDSRKIGFFYSQFCSHKNVLIIIIYLIYLVNHI